MSEQPTRGRPRVGCSLIFPVSYRLEAVLLGYRVGTATGALSGVSAAMTANNSVKLDIRYAGMGGDHPGDGGDRGHCRSPAVI